MQPAPTTTTTTTTTTVIKEPCMRFDPSYAFSVGGILKLLQIILNLIGLILILASEEYANLTRSKYYCFVAGSGFCISLILIILYFFHIIQAAKIIPWFKVELSYCLLWILFHLIAGFLTIGIVNGYLDKAGYFAFAAMGAYTLEALYNICRITVRSA